MYPHLPVKFLAFATEKLTQQKYPSLQQKCATKNKTAASFATELIQYSGA